MNVILIAVIVLGCIGLVASIVLYVLSKKFAVKEDPRIPQVLEALPGANCGGCGFPGCGGMAAACVKAADNGSLDGLNCPVGGAETMAQLAAILGMEVKAAAPKVAIVRCQGSCENRPRIAEYDGVRSCRVANTVSMGETACAYGCLGCGDCVSACQFGAIKMNAETGLPEVDTKACVACGACATACPRHIIEVRNVKGAKKMAVAVMCMNKDKGAAVVKACKVSCIACSKCVKVCEFDAIHVEGNVAYIDPDKCRLCRKCEDECPRKAIVALNMPERKPKPAAPKPAATAATAAKPAPATATPAAKPEPKPAAKPVAEKPAPAAPAPAEKPAATEKPAPKEQSVKPVTPEPEKA